MINSRLETHIKLLPPHCCPWSRSPWQQAGGVLRCSIHPLMLVCRVFNFNTSSATQCLCRSVFCLPVALCPSPSVCPSFHCCPSVSAQLHFLFFLLPLKYYFFSSVSLICSVNTALGVWQSIRLFHHRLPHSFISCLSSQQFNVLYEPRLHKIINGKAYTCTAEQINIQHIMKTKTKIINLSKQS